MIELISARQYYGKGRTGQVVLVDGNPTHFTGPTALTEAEDFAEAMSRRRNRAVFERWLKDGRSWIGVFQNIDMGHPQVGRRIALCFDTSLLEDAQVDKTKAPDTAHGIGWRYVLKAKCLTVAQAELAMTGKDLVAA